MIALGCVTGRFQPVHRQHLELFEIALAECEHLIIAVTNPDSTARREEQSSAHRHTASANPFTYFERARLLATAAGQRGWRGRVTVVPFDLTRLDLCSQYVPLTARQFVRAYTDWEREKARWLEQAGYTVALLDGDPSARISASEIRAGIRAKDVRWHSLVPSTTVPLLEEFLGRVTVGESG